MNTALEILVCALLLAGAAFALVGSWGLVTLSDFFKRLHGPTKASTLGVGGALLASMLWQAMQGEPSLRELLVTLFLFMTAPVSAHMMAKAALALDPSLRPPVPPAPDATGGRD
ncbi:MAG: Na+/H+ antiporter subunit G [Arenimonas sp.]|uniref:Na+/H+ antiporter subunit G n=1 Tax=Arenimonas sp. TaxID=1872635 RepID=UPI0031B8A45E|nr:Na+/H+ antiporter subunit G [Arenimonas sp.]